MFKDLPEGQTHSENDGCGEKEHNKSMTKESILREFDEKYRSFKLSTHVDSVSFRLTREFFESSLSALEAQARADERERCVKEIELAQTQVHGGGNGRRILEQLKTNIRSLPRRGEGETKT